MSEVNNKTKEQLIEELKALRQCVAELVESEDKCERSGGGLRNDCQELFVLQHDLRERIKELTCLYSICQLISKPSISLEEVFNGVVDLVTSAWQYPEVACTRIIFDGKEFKTDNFRLTKWKQSSDIKLNGETMGSLEVYYLEEKPEIDEGPFLKEEKVLIEGVSRELGNFAERKQAEEKLREGRAFVENLIASMKDGFSILDNQGVHLNVNAALCQMTGFTREELIGVGPPHPYWPEEAYEEIQTAFKKTLRGEFSDFELTFKRKNGERFPVIVSPSWLKDKEGNVISYYATIRDITERKRAEKELRRSELRLRLLAQRVTRAQEEERARIARELHDQVAQELVVARREALSLTESLKETAAYNRLADLVGLVDKLLDTVHNISVELRPKMLDELGLVKALQWYTEDFEHRTGISCLLNTRYGTIQEGAIREEVAIAAYRIFQEAMVNALRHSKADKVVIGISVRKGRLIIAITDNGIGIDTGRLKDSSSLGLLGMMERASIVGGSLQIRGNPGRDTRVTMYLPLQQA